MSTASTLAIADTFAASPTVSSAAGKIEKGRAGFRAVLEAISEGFAATHTYEAAIASGQTATAAVEIVRERHFR